ncbi:hypothetical protein CTI12_AA256040 [Artemisia annua]|uniref:Uncharacterized protein n=1 Tax=Artemisia annua TaxID=35608 RepID=A0A2U1LUJ6_ARTAN|nr:hypothetical protein CTI12_AA256040 [Artemisia annua]
MTHYRSNSYNYTNSNNMQLDTYNNGTSNKYELDHPPRDFRSYSVSYKTNMDIVVASSKNDFKLKKGKSTNGSMSKSWRFSSDPEFQRKKRVAGYKVFSVEGKLKGGFRKSFRWIKDKYTNVVYGI